MKIIDYEKFGNVIRFYLGKDDLDEWWGDDWDDKPYEHNAGNVYKEFQYGSVDIAFPSSYVVLEPKDDYRYEGNSPWCKYDFEARRCPCIIAVPVPIDEYGYEERWNIEDSFSLYMGANNSDVVKFYFGDKIPYEEKGKLVVWNGM